MCDSWHIYKSIVNKSYYEVNIGVCVWWNPNSQTFPNDLFFYGTYFFQMPVTLNCIITISQI